MFTYGISIQEGTSPDEFQAEGGILTALARGEVPGYAALRCGSATLTGSPTIFWLAFALPKRTSTSFMVSWTRVFGLWNLRVAFEAS